MENINNENETKNKTLPFKESEIILDSKNIKNEINEENTDINTNSKKEDQNKKEEILIYSNENIQPKDINKEENKEKRSLFDQGNEIDKASIFTKNIFLNKDKDKKNINLDNNNNSKSLFDGEFNGQNEEEFLKILNKTEKKLENKTQNSF